MRKQLGRGVGSWTASKDAEFSNFIWGSGNDMFDNVREQAIERARLKILADKKAKKEAEAKAKEEARLKALKPKTEYEKFLETPMNLNQYFKIITYLLQSTAFVLTRHK